MQDGSAEVYEQSYVKDRSDSDDSSVDSCENYKVTAGGDPAAAAAAGGGYINVSESELRRPSHRRRASLPSARYDKSVDPVKSAVIWPEPRPVGSRAMTTKSDPVSRFQQYQQQWSKSKVPEEKKHKNLRWAVREQMLYRDIIYEKPQKKYVENKYVVPTDKKRKDLRWRIRADMAAGILPSS